MPHIQSWLFYAKKKQPWKSKKNKIIYNSEYTRREGDTYPTSYDLAVIPKWEEHQSLFKGWRISYQQLVKDL